MDPFTVVSTATAIAKATGLSKWLGNKIAGKNGEKVAEQVVNIASAVTGGGSAEDVIKALSEDAKLRQELHFKLLDHSLEFEKLHYADVANARQMQVVALQQDDVFSKRFIYYFAAFWSLFCGIYILWITFGTIPTANVRFADTILGFVLGTLLASIFAYFFGSTRGSDSKNTTIAELAKKVTEK